MPNVLFVCSRNRWRSRTAEDLFSGRSGLSVRSCGTARSAVRRASRELIAWADEIICFEHHHRDRLVEMFGQEALLEKTLFVLDIPDEFQRGDQLLISQLRDELDGHWG